MPKQISLLDLPLSLDTLPTAKVKRSDKVSVHSWTNFYASFSESFVGHSLSSIDVDTNSFLLDPFVGSGTTLVSALKKGVSAVGVDLDPFSCLLSRAKIAINADEKAVKKILQSSKRKKPLSSFSEDASALFDQNCLCYASSVFTRLYKKTNSNRETILNKLLADVEGEFDSEVVALTALCIGAAYSASLIKGSNPTWYRVALEGEVDVYEELYESTISTYKKMINDLSELKCSSGKRNIQIINKNFREIKNEINKYNVTHMVTSPPYLTRLDYVIKHLPNLLILSGLIDVDIDKLRRNMIGTSKIIEKENFPKSWGKLCLKTLKKIEGHKSYATKSYYIWTYSQYFKAMYEGISILYQLTNDGFKGILVVQNSFYKDVYIPLSEIICEMLDSAGFKTEIVKKDLLKTQMKFINPKQKKVVQNKPLTEDVIFITK